MRPRMHPGKLISSMTIFPPAVETLVRQPYLFLPRLRATPLLITGVFPLSLLVAGTTIFGPTLQILWSSSLSALHNTTPPYHKTRNKHTKGGACNADEARRLRFNTLHALTLITSKYLITTVAGSMKYIRVDCMGF